MAHSNLIFPLSDTPGEPQAPQRLQRGACCAAWEHPCSPPSALPSSCASPPVRSSASLPPRELSREKTGNRCCVNLCSINFDNDFHTLCSAAVHTRVGAGTGSWLVSAGPGAGVCKELCHACCCTHFRAPLYPLAERQGCILGVIALSTGLSLWLRKLRHNKMGAAAHPSSKAHR